MKKRNPTVEIDQDTHRKLKILAAVKAVSIKAVLKELVEIEKEKVKL